MRKEKIHGKNDKGGKDDQSKTTRTMKRIAIFGRPGSGKSVLAKSLGKALDIPLYHLDCYYYGANWTVRDKTVFLQWQQQIIDQDKWILDGNCLDSLEMRFSRADVAIYFNRSKCLCYWRICKRRFVTNKAALDRPADCPEEIAWILLTYMWKFERLISGRLLDLHKKYPHVHLYEIKSDADIELASRRVLEPNERVREVQ